MLKPAILLQRGVTLIEVLITLAVIGIALTLGTPAYSLWISNTQIRTAAESMLGGIQLARAEGLKRNSTVRFQLMTSTDSSCALSTAGTNWYISVNDASGKCDMTALPADPSCIDPAIPCITRFKAGGETTKNVTVDASQSAILFNGLGQVTPTPATMITVSLANPSAGTCANVSGKMHCLQVQVTAAGQARMCDPAVSTANDPRKC